uniref:Genome polyprotein n=4 Tax=Boosepivirus sp. TaxID=2809206 RepID=A0AA51U530_9PICO|nr:polyprotein [Boosepivirus sp.]
MAVLSVPEFSGIVIVPLTIRSIFLHVRYYISFKNGGKILKQYCIPISNRHQRRWLNNTGVSQSKQSSGNRSENLSANNGSSITTVNYYGAYYAGAKGEASLQMDPEKFTKPIVELANGPALKSPSIEECGYSDRIIQITAGNSTITTQEAAKAIVAYGEWPNNQQYNKGQSVDKDSKPGPSVERFYTLDSIQWTSTFKGRAYRLPGVLTNLGMFGQNCTYHYLLNTGYVVHVQVNATKFHAGMLVVAAIPECQVSTEPSDAMDLQDEFFRQYPLHQLTVFPHQLINLRTNNSATIIIPYINCNPSDSPLAHNNVTIVIAQVAQLTYGTGASTFVPITTTIGPMNTSFSGIRNAVIFQGVPTFNVPGSGQFMTTLKNDGYPAIPFFEQVKDVHIPGRVRNLMEVCQIDTFCNAHSGSPVINIAPGDYNNRPIANWDMSLLSTLFETTYLGKFAKFYSQYRGSIKITFIMCGTALTTGKLLISYTPPGGDAPQNRTDAMLGTHMIWDIGLQSSVTFVIPYISATQYRFSNVSNNVLSYCGYISVFMQTAIVTPPSTSQVVPIAIMASACEDMEFRLATDNAYYQGINDDITALVENKIKTILKSTETPAITGPSLPNTLSIQEGDSVALTSAETGASSSTQPGQVMETREIPLTFSKLETSVESFLSRYSVFFEGEININSGGSGFVEVPLWVNQDATTQLAVRTKYRMFTYLKMHFDIIIIITMKEGARANNLIVTSPQPYTFQAIFSPAGAPKPTTWDSAEWDVPTTPSIYFKSTDPPASIRLPFMSPSFAYPIFYDGYSNFETQTNQYGLFPGNNMGSLFLRSLAKHNVVDSVAGKFNVKCFSRPLDIQAWVPRPIVTLKDTVYLSNSRGRVEPVSHNTGNLLHTRTGPFGVDMRVQTGPKRKSKPYAHIRNNPPPFYKKFPVFTYCSDDNVSFHGIPITKDVIAIPYHLSFDALKLDDKYCDYKVVYSSINFDLTLIRCKHDYEPVKLVPPSGYLWSSCYTKLFQKTLRFSKFKDLPSCWFNENGFVEEHEQFSMIECNLPVKSGWCGSPLYNSEGVIGMSTGTDVHWSTYTVLLEVPAVVGLVTIDEQGLTDCTSSLFSSLGSAFGRSAVESATKAFKENVDVASYTNETVKSVISLLVKAITVTVMIARSDDKIATAVGLGVLLGTDLLIGSPFDWLREKVSNILGVKNAQCQGPIDWLKDFNVVCTSMKWIDWIGEKILSFVEWIKSLLVVDEDKEKFKEDIKLLPDLIQKFDKVIKNPSRVSNVEKEKLCDSIINLKMRADKYGIIRNFATSQLLEKYNKAIQVKSSLNRKRFEPIAVLIHGEPGTGKSLSTIAIGKILSKHLGADEPYSLPPDPKYFDGYEQQPVVIMDDVAQNPDGEDLKLFCQMVSTTTFHVPMADLPDKGKTFISDFVLASTNCNGDLTPPTVREPLAIKRRFYLDLDIEIKDEYKVNGRLDANKALQFDGKKCANFKNSCPLFNGAAVVFKDRRTNMRYNMDNLITKLLQEHDNRNKCLSQLDKVLAFEQGAVCPEFTFKCDKIEPKPCPKEIIDLIRSVPDEKIIQYCAKQGWLLEPEDNVTILREEINTNLRDAAFILSILASLAGLAMFVYFVFKNAYQQGAYSDCIQNKQPKPPIKRMVVPQGATEFELSLLRKSLFQVKTEKGEFTGVGLYEKFMILPTHACPTSRVEFESKEYNVLEIFNLSNDKGPLEVSVVKLDRPVNFRDIRNYLPEHFSSVKCNLVVNSTLFPNYLVDVGRVSSFGYLNLSYKNVYNTCTYMFPTRIGQCGGLLVTQDHKIIAMHIGGDGANGYGAILTRKMFAEIQGHITSVEKTDRPVNISTRTAFRPSVFYDVFPGEKEPAVLHPKDPRLSRYVDFDKDLFSKYLNMRVEKMDIPVTENMHVAIKHYASRIRTLLPPDYKDPMGLTEVIYGVPGLDGIDLTTSAGFPYVQQGIKKRDLIPEKGQPLNRLTEALDLHGYDLPFITYLKDELRPKEKIEFGKTRLIECSSLNDTIRMKKKFGNLFKTYHLNPGIVTGSAVGCDPDIHWSLFYTQFGGEPLIAFDYKNFDGSLHKVWFKCLILFLQELGFDNVDEIRHIMNSVHIYKNIEYKVEGGMPSGTSGTSIFNSIINNIIIRTLVLDVYKGIDLDFLKILCYGDDLIVTYPFQLDASLIAEKGLDYGLHMTPPDKSKEFNEITWNDVTFLKRKFVPDEEFPFLIHPVYDINNVFESARWCKSAGNTQEHILSLCQLAWHSGKEVYNQFLDKITSVPVGRALYLPSYEVLRKNWLDKF